MYSHSKLAKYETCPRMYHETVMLKRFRETQGPEAIQGNRVHAEIENYLQGEDTSLRPSIKQQIMVRLVNLMDKSTEMHVEKELAVDRDFNPAPWGDCWIRGKIDCLIINGTHAEILDWKTGKVRPGTKQLDFYAFLTFINYPNLESMDATLVWLKTNSKGMKRYTRESTLSLASKILNRTNALERDNKWLPRQSGLCKRHCVVTTCPYNGQS